MIMIMIKKPQPAYIPCVEKLKPKILSKIESTSVLVEEKNTKPIIFEIGQNVAWSDLAKSKFKSFADNDTHIVIDIISECIAEVSKQNITIDNGISADAKWFVKV